MEKPILGLKQIIKLASRAPFGRIEETIIDTNVWCTWQLNPGSSTDCSFVNLVRSLILYGFIHSLDLTVCNNALI